MHRFKNMKVWKMSMKLSTEIYRIVADFPVDEKCGLTSQIKRATVSIASNIAEGSSRKSNKDFMRFLSISLGSSFELETQLLLSIELGLISQDKMNGILKDVEEIQSMLIGFQNWLESNNVVSESEAEYFTSFKI